MKEEQRNRMREMAHKYLDMGFSVFPAGRDKKPLIKWVKYQKERTTHKQIEEWFKQWPDMNVGIATGALSGIVVIDVEAGGSIDGFPSTVTAQTGGKGWHLLYKYPGYEVRNSTRITELTDVRADGGYILAVPSISDKGPYEWIKAPWEVEMAKYPSEIINSLN